MKLKMNGTLEEWWKILETDNANDIRKVLRRYTPQNRLLVALAMSYAKWHVTNPKRGDAYCGLCEYYDSHCSVCPLCEKNDWGCLDAGHPWRDWIDNQTDKSADAVFKLVEAAYRKELRRCAARKSSG